MGNCREGFGHCTASLAGVIHGSKNTVSIIGFLGFRQCLHSDLSGSKAGVIKRRSPGLPTNTASPEYQPCIGAAHGLADTQLECSQSLASGFGNRLGVLSLKKDLVVKVWTRLLVEPILRVRGSDRVKSNLEHVWK